MAKKKEEKKTEAAEPKKQEAVDKVSGKSRKVMGIVKEEKALAKD